MKNKIVHALLFFLVMASILISGCASSDVTKEATTKDTTPPAVSSNQTANGVKDKQTAQETATPAIAKSGAKLIAGTIVKNIDGDTIEIEINGKAEKVRMLCVDTPETHHPRLGVQPFGPEASDYTKKILPVGTKVEIEPGIGSGRDKYGRLLAYIYIDGKMFNEMLLEQGLARVAYIYAPNTQYVDEFYAIQKEAQKKGIGIWSIENYAQEDGYNTDAAKGTQEKDTNSKTSTGTSSANSYQNNPSDDKETNIKCEGKIKGNANSHIYHVPGGSFYESTKNNIVWFCSEKEAEDAGYRKSKK
ncbi:thermonuclease family protein [Neobacillus vireti]|uniref:Thermonuclease n=1 Tax=Neobacillus vireti LMG 21834 TaxID=1131730 RepID=A0AB94IH77_9BACI|nr:thermonuclease family protein [Neobacillus vireti]ETI66470.1 thermonuclease [Neobacillus vireti LMG 21834]KLT17369.1 hypothetical protein AA980_15995 [Neobacillus vireti]